MQLQPGTTTKNGIRVTGRTVPTVNERLRQLLDKYGFVDSRYITSLHSEWGTNKNTPVAAMSALQPRVQTFKLPKGTMRIYLKQGHPVEPLLERFPDAVPVTPPSRANPKPEPFPAVGFKTRLVERYEAADGSLWDAPEDAQRHTWVVPLTAALNAAGVPDAEAIATIVAGIVRDPSLKA